MKLQIKIILFSILITIGLTSISCMKLNTKVNISYYLLSPKDFKNLDTIPKDTFTIYFADGFNSDRVKLFLNGKKNFNKKISTNPIAGAAGIIGFRKGSENIIQLAINGEKSDEFILEKKFNNAIINLNHKSNNEIQFDLIYLNHIPIFD